MEPPFGKVVKDGMESGRMCVVPDHLWEEGWYG
jgi:hypothetical protein